MNISEQNCKSAYDAYYLMSQKGQNSTITLKGSRTKYLELTTTTENG